LGVAEDRASMALFWEDATDSTAFETSYGFDSVVDAFDGGEKRGARAARVFILNRRSRECGFNGDTFLEVIRGGKTKT